MNLTLPQIARALGGEVSSGQVIAPGPGHSSKDRSMAVKIGGAGQLVVSSFAGDSQMDCLRFTEQKLGIVWQPDNRDGASDGVALAFDRMHARAINLNGGHHANANVADASPAADGRQRQALRIWAEGVDPRGSIVETYLASRGLTLPDGAAMSTIRFHANCPFGAGVRHPCMVAAMRSIETGAVTAIHRTALSVDVEKIDRKMLGPAAGTAIMLAELDAERGTLTIGEGIESALSGLAMGYAPAWAMGSANGIKNLPVLNGVDTLTILGEVDGGANLAACRETGARWRAAQREVFLAMPKPGMGSDANDAWLARQGDNADALDVREFGEGIGSNDTLEAPSAPIRATPFAFVDPSTIPTRKWLYGRHYIRRFVSATVAPGGVGKSSLGLVESLAMVTGRALLGVPVPAPLRVWVWNGEDPREELERRIAGVCLHYAVTAQQIGGRLFLDSGRDLPIRLVEMAQGGRVVVAVPTVEGVEQAIRDNGIDMLSIDPFVSSHGVPENDNMGIDRAVKTWAGIADRTGCSIELVHHVRKGNGGEGGYTVEDARGGSSLIGAVRSARVLNVMTKEEAERAGVETEQRRLHFRVDDGKANMAPPMDRAIWRKLVGVGLGNGLGFEPEDNVGVVTAWEMPGVLDEVTAAHCDAVIAMVRTDPTFRIDAQANNWIGHAVAGVLDLDLDRKADREQINRVLRMWIENGALATQRRADEHRKMRTFVTPGKEA